MRKLDKRSDIVGKVFNGNEVLEVTDKLKHNCRVFRAKCKCGKEYEQVGHALKKGFGCGCKIDLNGRKTDENDLERYLKYRYTIYKNGATRRSIEFNLTKKAFNFLVQRPCYYCGQEPVESIVNRNNTYSYKGKSNGIDRKDNNKPYNLLNCVPCCTTCNMMKKTLGYEEFISHCIKISVRSLEKVTKAFKK